MKVGVCAQKLPHIVTWRDGGPYKALQEHRGRTVIHPDWMDTRPKETLQSKWYWNGDLKKECSLPNGEMEEKYSKHRKQHVFTIFKVAIKHIKHEE